MSEEKEKVESTPEEVAEAPAVETEDFREKYLCALAELDNFRKRTERDRQQSRAYALEGLVRDLLPVLDDLDLAIGAEGDADAIREGVSLAAREARKVLVSQGLKEIEALGQPFDPRFHEAMGFVPGTGEPPNTVVVELQKGYTMHDRVLRPSRVQIAMAMPQQQAEEDAE